MGGGVESELEAERRGYEVVWEGGGQYKEEESFEKRGKEMEKGKI